MTWTGRAAPSFAVRAAAMALAFAIAVAVAALVRPEAILLSLITVPAALLASRPRVVGVALEGTRLTLTGAGLGSNVPRTMDVAHGGSAELVRWTGPAATSRGLALRFSTSEAGAAAVVIGAVRAERLASPPYEDSPHPGAAQWNGPLESCVRVEVVLPADAFAALMRAVNPRTGGAVVTLPPDAVPAPGDSARAAGVASFDLWINPRFPYAFLAAVGAVALGITIARFACGLTGADLIHGAAAGTLPYIAAALLTASVVYDALALRARRSPALAISVAGQDLILRDTGRPHRERRAPLGSVRVTKHVWERQQADLPELNWKRLPALKLAVGEDRPWELTVGAGVESSDRTALGPLGGRASAAWAGDLPRIRPPKYLALAEDWPALVNVLTSAP